MPRSSVGLDELLGGIVIDCAPAEQQEREPVLTGCAVPVLGQMGILDFSHQFQRIVWRAPRRKPPEVWEVRAKIRIAKVAEHDLLAPDAEQMVLVLTAEAFLQFHRSMATIEARSNINCF